MDKEHRFESYVPPRNDNFQYYYFTPEDNPTGAQIAKSIQAESYVKNRIVRPAGLITLPDGTRILSPEVTNPSGIPYKAPQGSQTVYALGIEKGSTDFSAETGRMVAWRKFYAPPTMPLEALPAYQFSKESLWPEGEQYLRQIAEEAKLVVVEPEALGKTENAGRGAIKEFIRNEIQRVFGNGEVWFMGLVEKTVFGSWVHIWGKTAIRQIGDPKKTPHPYNYDDVYLVPTVVDIDQFYASMEHDILSADEDSRERLMKDFIYMSDGISDHALGPELAEFRQLVVQELRRRDIE